MAFDHIGFNVADLARSRAFYAAALAPLGMGVLKEGEGWAALGRDGQLSLWIGAYGPAPGPVHIAFAAPSREAVRAFHAAALEAGGADNGGPGLRPNYYAAFVHDPDGHNVDAVCRQAGE